MAHAICPTTAPDPTFDLNYAAPGSVIVDPTNPWNWGGGNLLMVYEGTNRCIGISTKSNGGNNFYSTIGIATSNAFGYTWPTYRANFTALPGLNQTEGPQAPTGAFGHQVCWGNFCPTSNWVQPPLQYGRYAVSGPVVTVQDAMNQSKTGGLAQNMGESEPAAFVDDVHRGFPTYAYVVHTYAPGPFEADSPLYPGVASDLSISRIQLNGGTAPMEATKWYDGQFNEPGLGENHGGHESPIFPDIGASIESYQHCMSPSQERSSASISYSLATQEYLLLFVCVSPTDPKPERVYQSGPVSGGAWLYSTIDASRYDLSHQEQWSTPNEVTNSWSIFETDGECTRAFDGWYPSLMSLDADPGHLNPGGYVFYMNGCTGAETTSGRVYSTRAFTIQVQ
jgi:hypothetical protein